MHNTQNEINVKFSWIHPPSKPSSPCFSGPTFVVFCNTRQDTLWNCFAQWAANRSFLAFVSCFTATGRSKSETHRRSLNTGTYITIETTHECEGGGRGDFFRETQIISRMKNNITFITKPSCQRESSLYTYLEPLVHGCHFSWEGQLLIVTSKGAVHLNMESLEERRTNQWREGNRQCHGEARPKHSQLSHTTCNVVVYSHCSCDQWSHFPCSLERGSSSEKSRSKCSRAAATHCTATPAYMKQSLFFILHYLYINISSLK